MLYPELKLVRMERLGSAGGFSGAELWRCFSNGLGVAERYGVAETYFLRRWPGEHPSDAQLSWIHRVIRHAFAQGCHFLAVPLVNSHGETFSRFPSATPGESLAHRWELSPWMPGAADFSLDPNSIRITNMMRALGQFHLASAQITLDFHSSHNLLKRVEQLKQFLPGDELRQLTNLRARHRLPASSAIVEPLEQLTDRLIDYGPDLAAALLAEASAVSTAGLATSMHAMNTILPVQPVLRDIWHDHVLFSGNEVTGIIDYGAMQIDNVVFDIARLLGSTVADDPKGWELGLAAYETMRRLSATERALVPWIDRCGVLLGSLNWLRWLLVENRQFGDWESVAARLAFLSQRFRVIVA